MSIHKDLIAKAEKPGFEAARLHALYRGKIQTMPKCAIAGLEDFAIWYTPGVAMPCRGILADPEQVYRFTNKGNSIAVVSDGTRVLGLGDIGPEAGLPVMEGKALLFKYLGGIDAVPICLATKDPDEFIRTVELLEPSFGGINLEDIAQPKCFRILAELRKRMRIPVWHDDQQGSATVVLAGLLNALKIVGKALQRIRVAMIGMGAAGIPTYRFLKAAGVKPQSVVACDLGGILHKGRRDYESRQNEFPEQWKVCLETNAEGVTGGIREALRGADVCVAFSTPGPGIIEPEWIKAMAPDAIVFACANPIPEIWPWQAKEAGARIVCTGRSDLSNQMNNSLVFPGIFRGTLDVRARTITDEMAIAAARELAACAEERGISDESILPRMDDWEVVPRVAAATGLMAQEQGIARHPSTRDDLIAKAAGTIKAARDATSLLMEKALIPPMS